MKCDTHIFRSDTLHVHFQWKGTPLHSSGVSELNAQFACTVVLWLKNWKMTVLCDSIYHQHIMQVIGTVLLIHGHAGPCA